MNEPAKKAINLMELNENVNSSHFLGSSDTIEIPTLESAILNDGASDVVAAMAKLSTCLHNYIGKKDSGISVEKIIMLTLDVRAA